MKILAISDHESKYLWDYFEKSKLDGIDLIISCGDLSPHYLSFLATFTHAPVLYVHGNHDDCYKNTPPDGCICIDDKIYVHNGVRIMGLGGCMRYKPGTHQYTERQMSFRIARMYPKILFRRGVDIVVTHAPAYRINDAEDITHRGFKCFRRMMSRLRPKYLLHGHIHATYGGNFARETRFEDTTIINAYERYILEYDETGASSPKRPH